MEVLQDAWNKAQPKLAAIRSSLDPRSFPKPQISRVGKLDAELLDQELVQLLREPLSKAVALVNSSLRTRFEAELTLFIRLLLYKSSIWDFGATYGAKLQDLRYVVELSSDKVARSRSGLPRRTLLIHGTLTILIPYLHSRLRAYALSNAWPDAPTHDRRRTVWGILTSLESSHTLLGLVSFVSFLWDGRYRTVTERLLDMRLVPSRRQVNRNVSYEFMNRQMVWHAFTEFLLFLLPLIPARSIRGRFARLSSYTLESLASHPIFGGTREDSSKSPQGKNKKRGKYWSLPLDQCAICAENASFSLSITDSNISSFPDNIGRPSSSTSNAPQQDSTGNEGEPPAYPVYTPYRASCGDVYCYHCIVECMMRVADEGEEAWECLRCGEKARQVDRFIVDTVPSGSDVSEDSDMDVTDLSGSVGSYSNSGLSENGV